MAINPHDDYEALAKLLYPSIEASGNVYYGQTRKLTMDETLGKNDLGFESHVESIRVSDDNADYGYHYDNYLCWSIGSLKGSFKVDEFSDTLYAKYKFIITDKEVNNSLHSGSYNTYEKNVDLRLEELTTSDDLVDVFSDGRNFYVEQVYNDVYLYIVACPLNGEGTQTTYSDNNALRLTAVNDSVTISLSYSADLVSLDSKPEYQYRRNGVGEWITIDWQNDTIELSANEYIQVKLSNNFTNFSDSIFMHFVFSGSGSVKASGDIRSMLGTPSKQMYRYCYSCMFHSCISLIKAPRLPASKLEEGCYNGMFSGCTGLVTAPSLPATELAEYCYDTMFYGCTSLLNVPQLPANKLEAGCYHSMFENCSSLIKAQSVLPADEVADLCYTRMFRNCSFLTKAPAISANLLLLSGGGLCFKEMFYGCSSLTKAPRIHLGSIPYDGCYQMFYGCTNLSEVSIDATSIDDTNSLNNWLYGVSSSGTFYCKPNANIFDTDSSSGIPTGWTRKSVDEYNEEDISGEYSRGIMITSGYNSPGNGRGDITSGDTVRNMEQSFDENKTHQMGTYNSDGSYNQEVWGYKSFNSPVQFRNGIYGEDTSLIALPDSYYPQVTVPPGPYDSSYNGKRGMLLSTATAEINGIGQATSGECAFITKTYTENAPNAGPKTSHYSSIITSTINNCISDITLTKGLSLISTNADATVHFDAIDYSVLKNEYTVNIETSDIDGNNKASIQLMSDLANGNSQIILNANEIQLSGSISVTGDTVPNTDCLYDIGDTNHKYKAIHAYSLNGVLPYPDRISRTAEEALPKVGQIFIAKCINVRGAEIGRLMPGDRLILNTDDSSYENGYIWKVQGLSDYCLAEKVVLCDIMNTIADNVLVAIQEPANDEEYVVLSSAALNDDNNTCDPFLLIRVN